MNNKDYKPQIDGLRALAVLPVIFFHAGFKIFQGGFVGVDVFFVISGYLITTIILKEISKNKFNLKDFYTRRARRILPALYFVTFISIPFSIFLMTGEDLKFFSKEVISVIAFISNFFFWKNTGYFSPSSDMQPLLHTWSLGVEEQFYIFFPLFMIFVSLFHKKKLILFISIIFILSLTLAQIGGNFKIQNLSIKSPFLFLPFEYFWQAGSANFYLPFGRIWELMSGSLAAIYLFKNKIKDKKSNNILSLIGFLIIIFSIIVINKNLQYPSIFTLLPVIGTLLVIFFSTKNTILNKLLSLRLLVFTGLISYSLYLWHQPILAFNRIYFDHELSILHSLFLLLIAFIFSIFSWKYIEKPFRNKKKISNKKAINYLIVSALIIVSFSYLIYFEKIKSYQKPLPQNIINSFKPTLKNNCFDIDYAHTKEKMNWFCELGALSKTTSFVVVGDSHALALKPSFDKGALANGKKGMFVGFSGCPALLDIYSVRPDRNIRNCRMLNKKIFEYIKDNKIKKIFLVSRWTYYTDGNYEKTNFSHISKKRKYFSNQNNSRLAFEFGLKNTVEKYENIGVEVIFVHQVPSQVFGPDFIYNKAINKNDNNIDINKLIKLSVDYNKHMLLQKFVRDKLKEVKNLNHNFKEIDLNSFFCDNKKCKIGTKKASYYSDKNHLSAFGAKAVEKEINLFLK